MQPEFRFEPLSFSWVALHPNPQGVIQFIGGAGFGTFPTLFYRYFLQQLYTAGYTLVALPFRFSFRHWAIALALLEEHRLLSQLMAERAGCSGYATEIYHDPSNYFWIGHSLGCKYVELLELLSGEEWVNNVSTCVDTDTVQWLADRLPPGCAIRGQRSLLLAPDISDTESAIPIPALARLLNWLGLGVRPGRHQTQCLIRNSRLFNLTAMISFAQDRVAGSVLESPLTSDVRWVYDQLQEQALIHHELAGKHLEPVGIRIGDFIADFNPMDKFIKPLSQRKLESVVLEALDKLKYR